MSDGHLVCPTARAIPERSGNYVIEDRTLAYLDLQAQAAERGRQADDLYHLAKALHAAAGRDRWFRRRRLRRLAGDVAAATRVLTEEAGDLET